MLGKLAFGAVSLALAGQWAISLRRPTARSVGLSVAASALVVGAAVAAYAFGIGTGKVTFPLFADYFRAWSVLDRAAGPRGVRVAYAGTDIPYYLLGRDLRNDVEYVNIDDHPDWLMHDYHLHAAERGDPPLWPTPRPGWDRLHPDRGAWLENLERRGIQYLVVARAKPEEGPFNIADREKFTIERVWADALPGRFTPIYGVEPPDPEMKVYRFHPAENATDRASARHE
jgi:hypothetical protein